MTFDMSRLRVSHSSICPVSGERPKYDNPTNLPNIPTNEGEVELYDKDGNRLDPKTMKPMRADNVSDSGEHKKLLDATQLK